MPPNAFVELNSVSVEKVSANPSIQLWESCFDMSLQWISKRYMCSELCCCFNSLPYHIHRQPSQFWLILSCVQCQLFDPLSPTEQ